MRKKSEWAEKLEQKFVPQPTEQQLPLSVIVPVFNCMERIDITLASIKAQHYEQIEVIIIDAGSTDHTLNIVNNYSTLISRIYTVSDYNLSEMLNRGISLATGRYITFLYPGSFYLSPHALHSFAERALKTNFPDLIYSGMIQRELRKEPQIIHRPLTLQRLQKGIQPTALPACWFRSDLFETMGKINASYSLRADFDLFCRVEAIKERRVEVLDRVYMDYDLGLFSYGKALVYASETWRVLGANYGALRAIRWFLSVDHWELVKFFLHYSKQQIFRR